MNKRVEMVAEELKVEYRTLVDRVNHGSELTASPKLQKFLLYVTDCALEDHPDSVTEQQIGVHVFGKRAGYNSSEDSIVRSQARLLRQKLESYFEHEGRDEPVVITIPKGQYLPRFVPRPHLTEVNAEVVDPHKDDETEHPPLLGKPRLGGRSYRRIAVVLLLFASGLVAGLYSPGIYAKRRAGANALWKPFLSASDVPLVIYSNPTFVGDPYTGLHIRREAEPVVPGKPVSEIDETYTGTGEAEAIHQITHFFDECGATFILKRTRLVTWDEARSRNLIFIGAPSQNTSLQDLPITTNFRVRLNERNQGYIENAKPQPGEPTLFAQTGSTGEYAIIALLPGPDPDKRVLILSGLTTNGTQAATEFASSAQGASELIRRAGTKDGAVRPFEAILQVRISQGVPLDSQLAYLHQR